MQLGRSVAFVELGDIRSEADDITLPLTISPDRRSVAVYVPADPRLGPRNIICMRADLAGASKAHDWTESRLLDGFDGSEGNLGLYATDDTLSQLRCITNQLIEQESKTIWDHPTWTRRV